jgi:hypothetical protein
MILFVSMLALSLSGVVSGQISSQGAEVEKLWDAGNLPYHDVHLAENQVMAETQSGDIEAFSTSGEELWSAEVGEPSAFDGSDTVYGQDKESDFGGDTYYIVSYSTDERSEMWREEISGPARSISAGSENVIIGYIDGSIEVRGSDGNRLWKKDGMHESYVESVEIGDNSVYSGGRDGDLKKYNRESGDLVWSIDLGNWVEEGDRPVWNLEKRGEKIFLTTDQTLVVLNDNGEMIWKESIKGEYISSYQPINDISIQEEYVLLGVGSGNIIGIDRDENIEAWNFKHEDHTPDGLVAEGNNVYISDIGGDVAKFSFDATGDPEPGFSNLEINLDASAGRVASLSTPVESENVIERIDWDFDTGNGYEKTLRDGKDVTYEFPSGGTYNVKMRVIDSVGVSDTVEKSINIDGGKGLPSGNIYLPEEDYSSEGEATVFVDIETEGRYRIELEGAGISYSETFDSEQIPREINVTPQREGKIEARLIAPRSYWQDVFSIHTDYEGDETVDRKVAPVTEVEGSSPEIEIEGDSYVLPREEENSYEEKGKRTYRAEVETAPDSASIEDYEWEVTGVLDEDIERNGDSVTVDWDSTASPNIGYYPIRVSATDEYGRTGNEEYIVNVKDNLVSYEFENVDRKEEDIVTCKDYTLNANIDPSLDVDFISWNFYQFGDQIRYRVPDEEYPEEDAPRMKVRFSEPSTDGETESYILMRLKVYTEDGDVIENKDIFYVGEGKSTDCYEEKQKAEVSSKFDFDYKSYISAKASEKELVRDYTDAFLQYDIENPGWISRTELSEALRDYESGEIGEEQLAALFYFREEKKNYLNYIDHRKNTVEVNKTSAVQREEVQAQIKVNPIVANHGYDLEFGGRDSDLNREEYTSTKAAEGEGIKEAEISLEPGLTRSMEFLLTGDDSLGDRSVQMDTDSYLVLSEDERVFSDIAIKIRETDGLEVQIYTNAEARDGIDLIKWDLDNDGEFEKEGREISHAYSQEGSKVVQMQVQSGDEVETVEKSLEVENNGTDGGLIDFDSDSPKTGDNLGIEVGIPKDGNDYQADIQGAGVDTQKAFSKPGRKNLEVRPSETGILEVELYRYEVRWTPLPSRERITVESNEVRVEDVRSITVDDKEETYSWGDKIPVTSNLDLSPVYWAEGFTVEEMEEDSISLVDKERENRHAIKERDSVTLMQDYVVHLCKASSEGGEVILTMGSEETAELCESEDSDQIIVDMESEFEVSKGDRVVFGPENSNSFKVDSIGDDLVNIVPSSDKADTGITERVGIVDFMDIEFESGLYRVSVVERGSESATMKLVRSYSSNFSCADYQTGENEYKFCTNQGDEAVKEVDLGYGRSVELNFVNNYYINDEKHTTLAGPEKTLTITHGEGQEYRGAEITVEEWRGLQRKEDYEAIIEVNIPEKEPEAWLEFGKNTYTSGDQVSLTAVAEQEGLYSIEVEGPGIDRQTDIDSGESTIEFQPNGEGTLEARAIAPGTWWNPLDNDKVVDTASVEVREPVEGENHRFGEKFTIQEGETTKIEGHDFHLTTLVGREETGYSSILWRESEDGDTNSGLVLLKKVNSMGLQYSDGFEAYGAVCSIDPEAETAEIIVKQERFNPWNACDRNPSEFRGSDQADYEITDYELGEKITLEEGEAVEFGESRAYLREIEKYQDIFLNDGNLEWTGVTSYWHPPTEGKSMTNYFYEGEIATATCEASESHVTLVMEETGEIRGEWPEGWCSEESDVNMPLQIEGGKNLNVSSEITVPGSNYHSAIEYSVSDSDREGVDRHLDVEIRAERGDGIGTQVITDLKFNKGISDLEPGTYETEVTVIPGDVPGEGREEPQTKTEIIEIESGESNVEISCEKSELNPGESTYCNVEEFEGIGNPVNYSWETEGVGEVGEDKSVEHARIHAPEVIESDSMTVGYRVEGEDGMNTDSLEIELANPSEEIPIEIEGGTYLNLSTEMVVPSANYRAEMEYTQEESIREDIDGELGMKLYSERGEGLGSPVITRMDIRKSLQDLEPGFYRVNVTVQPGGVPGQGRETEQRETEIVEIERIDIEPRIEFEPSKPETLEEISFEASPERDFDYSWDLNADREYEREGKEVSIEYDTPGSKNVSLRIEKDGRYLYQNRTVEVSSPEVSSSLELSKEEITTGERISVRYDVGKAIAQNGYILEIVDPSGEKVIEESMSSISGAQEYVPGRDSKEGVYTAKLKAGEGFLSSILRTIFGSEAEKSFRVVDSTKKLDEWRNYCQENGFDPLTASGRISCVKQLIGPECFKENPGQECIEIAESTCEYYVGTGFNPEAGRCRE